jgi:hypothetical protein
MCGRGGGRHFRLRRRSRIAHRDRRRAFLRRPRSGCAAHGLIGRTRLHLAGPHVGARSRSRTAVRSPGPADCRSGRKADHGARNRADRAKYQRAGNRAEGRIGAAALRAGRIRHQHQRRNRQRAQDFHMISRELATTVPLGNPAALLRIQLALFSHGNVAARRPQDVLPLHRARVPSNQRSRRPPEPTITTKP